MERLLAEIARSHFPNPPATSEQIASFEARVGWRLDDDLRAFYQRCDGVDLFEPRPKANYRVMSLAEIRRARVAIRGRDEDSRGPASWYTLVYCQDSDYIIVDVAQQQGGRYPLLDAWHESFPLEVQPVAASFHEFLDRMLASNNEAYWLNP